MTVIRNQITDIEGNGTPGWVIGRLVGPGLREATQTEIITRQDVQTAVDGTWELDLSPNSAESPYYVITEQAADYQTVQHVIHVVASDTPVWLGDVTVQVPLPVGRGDVVYAGPAGPPGPPGDPGPAGPAYSDAQARSVVGTTLVAGANITLAVDPTTGLVTITGAAGGGGGASPTFENIPAGSTLTVLKSGSTWPARPTARSDVFVAWKGPDPSPGIVASGTGGMLDGVDYRLVTP